MNSRLPTGGGRGSGGVPPSSAPTTATAADRSRSSSYVADSDDLSACDEGMTFHDQDHRDVHHITPKQIMATTNHHYQQKPVVCVERTLSSQSHHLTLPPAATHELFFHDSSAYGTVASTSTSKPTLIAVSEKCCGVDVTSFLETNNASVEKSSSIPSSPRDIHQRSAAVAVNSSLTSSSPMAVLNGSVVGSGAMAMNIVSSASTLPTCLTCLHHLITASSSLAATTTGGGNLLGVNATPSPVDLSAPAARSTAQTGARPTAIASSSSSTLVNSISQAPPPATTSNDAGVVSGALVHRGVPDGEPILYSMGTATYPHGRVASGVVGVVGALTCSCHHHHDHHHHSSSSNNTNTTSIDMSSKTKTVSIRRMVTFPLLCMIMKLVQTRTPSCQQHQQPQHLLLLLLTPIVVLPL